MSPRSAIADQQPPGAALAERDDRKGQCDEPKIERHALVGDVAAVEMERLSAHDIAFSVSANMLGVMARRNPGCPGYAQAEAALAPGEPYFFFFAFFFDFLKPTLPELVP